MSEPVAGWTAPVALGLIEPQLLAQVPYMFLGLDVLGSLVGLMFWYPAPLIGVGFYIAARVATTLDPQWWDVMWEHCNYWGYYEA